MEHTMSNGTRRSSRVRTNGAPINHNSSAPISAFAFPIEPQQANNQSTTDSNFQHFKFNASASSPPVTQQPGSLDLAFEPESENLHSNIANSSNNTPRSEVITEDNEPKKLRRRNVITETGEFLSSSTAKQRAWTLVTPKSDAVKEKLMRGLRDCYLFNTIDIEKILELVNVMRKRVVQKGEVVFRQGESGDYFYLVLSGTLNIYKQIEDGSPRKLKIRKSSSENPQLVELEQEQTDFTEIEPDLEFDYSQNKLVSIVSSGGYFGDKSLLFKQTRAASTVAVEDSILYLLDRVTFKHASLDVSESNYLTALNVLRSVPLLKSLTQDQLEDVAQSTTISEFQNNDIIINKGDIGSIFYIVKSGEVKITDGLVINENKKQETVLRQNDYFGELALLHDSPRAANVIALSERVTLLSLDKQTFNKILGNIREVLDINIRAFALQTVDVFKSLTVAQRFELFKLFTNLSLNTGEVLIRENEIGREMYIIRSGKVKVTKIYGAAVEVLRELSIGDVVGEMALLLAEAQHIRTATVTCVEPSEFFVLTAQQFNMVLNSEGPQELDLDEVAEVSVQRQQENLTRQTVVEQREARERELRELLDRVNNNETQQQNQQQNGISRGQISQIPNSISFQQQQQFQERLRVTNYELKDFRALCTLGTGTFGRVKLVIHVPTSNTYALKIQSKYQIMKYNLRQNIFNEKAILMSINHPFIVTLHQTFQDQDYLYMLLELVQGGELFTLLQNYGPRMQTGHHIFYVSCVLSALEALHSLNILYRDLKPENCIIDGLGYVKLVDFGFAKRVDRRTYTLCGTPEYFSPELVLGCGYSKGNDIWALGILAFEIIAGFTPFGTDEPSTNMQQSNNVNNFAANNNMTGGNNNMDNNFSGNQIYRRIVKEPISFPKDCRDGVGVDLITQLLKKEPNQRLGCGKLGIGEVKLHPWFERVDWDALLSQKIPAPWRPPLKNQIDAAHFDKYEEKYALIRYMCDPTNDPFRDF